MGYIENLKRVAKYTINFPRMYVECWKEVINSADNPLERGCLVTGVISTHVLSTLAAVVIAGQIYSMYLK